MQSIVTGSADATCDRELAPAVRSDRDRRIERTKLDTDRVYTVCVCAHVLCVCRRAQEIGDVCSALVPQISVNDLAPARESSEDVWGAPRRPCISFASALPPTGFATLRR